MERTAAFLFNDEGPMLVQVVTRESTTAPSRIKVAFTADLIDNPRILSGAGEEDPLPAQVHGQTAMLAEFRLEMN